VAENNLTHVFIDGQRVTFDRRDESVTLFPDEDFRFARAERIGSAEGADRDWIATAPDGMTRRLDGRKAVARWLIQATEEQRTARASERDAQRTQTDAAVDEALAIIHTVLPSCRRPGPLMGDPDARTFFVFDPEELRDLLVGLTSSR
jgi:hypothetical protein